MNIIVCIKQTFDTEADIDLDSEGKVSTKNVKLIINPYDEFALEEGIRLKEKFGGEITLVTLGGSQAPEALLNALAKGADKAVHISAPSLEEVDEWLAAEILAKAIASLPYDIILAGRIAIDDGSSQVAVRLAEKLDLPSVSTVVKMEINGTLATVVREIDGGTETVEVSLPAVITAQKGLNGNEPRYPTVVGIMKAKKKEIKNLTLADLDLADQGMGSKMAVKKYSLPSPRQGGRLIPGDAAQAARELASLLREEAKVL